MKSRHRSTLKRYRVIDMMSVRAILVELFYRLQVCPAWGSLQFRRVSLHIVSKPLLMIALVPLLHMKLYLVRVCLRPFLRVLTHILTVSFRRMIGSIASFVITLDAIACPCISFSNVPASARLSGEVPFQPLGFCILAANHFRRVPGFGSGRLHNCHER